MFKFRLLLKIKSTFKVYFFAFYEKRPNVAHLCFEKEIKTVQNSKNYFFLESILR